MKITVAENAGFCFGVKRASEVIMQQIESMTAESVCVTYGELIHNREYLNKLAYAGIYAVDMEQLKELSKAASAVAPVTVIIRTHGVTLEEEELLRSYERENPCFKVIDMTCPFVKRIQNIAKTESEKGCRFLILGSAEHPEVKGILSYASGERHAFGTADEICRYFEHRENENTPTVICAQTTQNTEEWKKTQKNIKNLYTNINFFDTICDVTEKRQAEAKALAESSDTVIVIGGEHSANTAQLYNICHAVCPDTRWIQSAEDLKLDGMGKNVSITAGASTPVDIILEVQKQMSMENLSFEEMLNDSLKTLHTGEVVTGTVTAIASNGIYLDLGTKVTGFIESDKISNEPITCKLSDMFKVGDEVKARVIRVNDGEGMATLDKRTADREKNWLKLVEAAESGELLEGTVETAIKGGVIIKLFDQTAFIPASHTLIPRDGDLNTLVGTKQTVKIIEVAEDRKRALASIKLAKNETKKAELEAIWAGLSVGQKYLGKVKNLTSYGAFVDIGGVDGMVHNSELSWKHIKHPSQVVSVGDEINVYIKELDEEKKRISLGYKTDDMDTWTIYFADHNVGDVVTAKITSTTPFGAFAEVFKDVEGLIHISAISLEKIAKVDDVLHVGDEVTVKITAIDHENRKLSLSIKALLEEAASKEAAEKAAADKAERDAARAEELAKMEEERAEMAPYIVGSID